MSVSDTITELGNKLAGVYKELVTNTVRFEELQRTTDKTLGKFEQVIERLVTQMSAMREEHVKEQASLRAEIRGLEARLNALSEHALHAVPRDAARDVMSRVASGESLRSPAETTQSSGALPPSLKRCKGTSASFVRFSAVLR